MIGTATAAKAHKNKGDTNVISHKNTKLMWVGKHNHSSFRREISSHNTLLGMRENYVYLPVELSS